MNPPDHASDGGPRKIRAFIALKTPREWEEKLGDLQRELKSKFGSAAFRWVKAEQIHITLRFFGWLTTAQADEVAQLLPAISSAHPPFALNCEGLGAFPNVQRPRVFWAGLKGDLVAAGALQSEINSATYNFGEPPEDRPFKPHMTLARIKTPERQHISDLEHVVARGFQLEHTWQVNELLLMESHLSPKGSTYETIAKFQLGR